MTAVTETSQWAPYRTSLLDDICYYWTTVASISQISSAIESPFSASHFQLKIIAAIWMNTLEHVHTILSELETMLWEIERMIAPHLSDVEKERYMARFTGALNEVNTLRRRMNWYVSEMENNLYSLGIDPSSSPTPASKAHEKNFLALHRKLVNYQSWAEKLMGVITSHVNLMETEKSISDSKSLSRLTVLGFFFVPISFVATFFSMGGDFGVGEKRFWVFWCVAVPVTVAALVVGFGRIWMRRLEEWRERRWVERESRET
ncbi:hypothetical protein BKA64DRAFT_663642 [Cadophora sp. MPI-SDFR-AT-0126]|nr:hypothetical protein BKA64DRAFT_663642 [Leotiomycetes sp. MPI-SDFR-AT-0126]